MFREKDLYSMPNFRKMEVDSTIFSLSNFAKSHDINYKLLIQFNPWLRAVSLHVKSEKKYILKIPTDTKLLVFDNFEFDSLE